jgi:ABC-2 type transport system permease protein
VSSVSDSDRTRQPARGRFSELLRVQVRLSLREPYQFAGLGIPIGLLVLFWYIGVLVPGGVANTGLTVLDLYIPTVLVIGYITLALIGLPVTFARDREIGWLRRVSTTPVPPSRLLAAQLVLNFIIAVAATAIVIVAGTALFGAPLRVGIEFVGVALLSIVEMFSLGLLIAALAPSQIGAQAMAGGLVFPLFFFSGLWVQPVQVGGVLETIMYGSPAGAAVRALLYTIFNATPPYTSILTMGVYTVLFAFIAIRYFRWE